MSMLRHFLAALLATSLLAQAVPAGAAITENDVKAAFLPKFARYVDWPAGAAPTGSEPFVLCIIGSNPFGDGIDTAAKAQSVDGRRIQVRRMDSAAGADSCQIAYVGGGRASELLASLRGKPILTVTDSANGSARGIIHFSVIDGRVRFAIDEADASRRGLTISSRLLALATSVKQR